MDFCPFVQCVRSMWRLQLDFFVGRRERFRMAAASTPAERGDEVCARQTYVPRSETQPLRGIRSYNAGNDGDVYRRAELEEREAGWETSSRGRHKVRVSRDNGMRPVCRIESGQHCISAPRLDQLFTRAAVAAGSLATWLAARAIRSRSPSQRNRLLPPEWRSAIVTRGAQRNYVTRGPRIGFALCGPFAEHTRDRGSQYERKDPLLQRVNATRSSSKGECGSAHAASPKRKRPECPEQMECNRAHSTRFTWVLSTSSCARAHLRSRRAEASQPACRRLEHAIRTPPALPLGGLLLSRSVLGSPTQRRGNEGRLCQPTSMISCRLLAHVPTDESPRNSTAHLL